MKSTSLHTLSFLTRLEYYCTAAAFLLFPVLFLGAQFLHPNLFQGTPITDGKSWISIFRGQSLLHAAHGIEFICAPLLMIMALHYKRVLRGGAPWTGFIGAVMAFIGALMLLGNKSALCLTISAFDTLPDGALLQMAPGLDVLLQRKGWMVLLSFLPLLPLGFAVIGIALFKTRLVPRWQSVILIIGSLMLANPEIEVINFIASFFLALSIVPYAVRLFSRGVGEEEAV